MAGARPTGALPEGCSQLSQVSLVPDRRTSACAGPGCRPSTGQPCLTRAASFQERWEGPTKPEELFLLGTSQDQQRSEEEGQLGGSSCWREGGAGD